MPTLLQSVTKFNGRSMTDLDRIILPAKLMNLGINERAGITGVERYYQKSLTNSKLNKWPITFGMPKVIGHLFLIRSFKFKI